MMSNDVSSEHETYGKFRSTGSDLNPGPVMIQDGTKCDSLSLSSEDMEIFSTDSSANTSECYNVSLRTVHRKGNLRLPEFGQDDILVKPSSKTNWILLPKQDENISEAQNPLAYRFGERHSSLRSAIVTKKPQKKNSV